MSGPIQRMSLANQAVDALLQLIEDRNLKANDVLPSTAELAEVLGVSRTVVREAIAELAGQGLFNRHQGRETVITLPSSHQLERFLHLRFVLHGHDYEDLQEFREVVEVGSARLAAERATESDIEAMERHLATMRTAVTDDDRFQADQAFHVEVARGSGNDMVTLTVEGTTSLLFQLRRRAWSGWTKSGRGTDPIIEAHALILERIRAHDTDGAAAAMKSHLAQASEGLENTRRD